MKLLFAFKNISANTFLEFVDKRENIYDYILHVQGKYPYSENYFLKRAEHFKNTLPNFENEILQIIGTTSQATIDYYFKEVIDICDYIKGRIDEKDIEAQVTKWNNLTNKLFEERIFKEREESITTERIGDNKQSLKNDTIDEQSILKIVSLVKSDAFKKKEQEPDLINLKFVHDYHIYVSALANYFFEIAFRYIKPYQQGKIKSHYDVQAKIKPVVFVEGEFDIIYIKKAAEFLGYIKLLEQIEIRQRGGYKNLNKLWDIYTQDNWETIPQKKLLLYDCDVDQQDDEIGCVIKRIIKQLPNHKLSKGIENLFPTALINRAVKEKAAFVDVIKIKRTIRGVSSSEIRYSVNDDEKKNLCIWICHNATAKDFKHFEQIFRFVSEII